MPYLVYNITWACIFLLNVSAVVMSFASPWGARDEFSTSLFLVPMAIISIAAFCANIIVTDIAAEYLCIIIGVVKLQRRRRTTRSASSGIFPLAVVPIGTEPYLVVYCLKSKLASDVKNVLGSLEQSWVNNKSYSNAVYLILSGTHDEGLYQEEMNAVRDWNLSHSENGVVCKYLRRTRSILYKYGQYLDLIMLLNGHDGSEGVALFKDSLSEGAGGCFDVNTDVDDFKGRVEYDRLVILDRDNVLGDGFFVKSDRVFGNSSCGEIDIIQPAIVPFNTDSRADTLYEAISISSHEMGSKLARSRREYFPSATFFGKGVIRRTKYNDILMGYNSETFTTEEDTRIPRDLVSHDIIESSIMNCVKDSSLEIFEGFPNTFLEWHVRQSRWDRGDMILSKYLFAFTYGFLANVFSSFSYWKCVPFYRSFSSRSTVYTGTFNCRVISVRPLVVTSALLYSELCGNTMFLALFAIYNVEILILPVMAKLATSTSFYKVLLLTIHDVYMGAMDIFYGSARTVRALISIACGGSGWVPSGDLSCTPFKAMIKFGGYVLVELVLATCILVWSIEKSIHDGGFNETYFAIIVWMALVVCHPVYVFVTAHKF